MSATWSAPLPVVAVDLVHEHPSLTEPVLRKHLRASHDWSPTKNYVHTYFQALVAHSREHRKAKLAVSS